jgi:hypothetical protein
LPWLGTSITTQITGLPPTGLLVRALGLGGLLPPLSLVTLLPQAAPGCQLLVAPDVLETHGFAGGSAVLQLAIPQIGSLVGLAVYDQSIAFEIGGAVTATNALVLTIGAQ